MDNPINVCLLNDSFPPVIDGVANVVLNYAKIIHGNHGNAVVVIPRYPGELYEYPFPIVHYPSIKTPKTAGYRTGLPMPGIIKEIKNYPIDIIHCHCPFVSSVISKSLRHATGAPIIMTYHTKFDIDLANNFDSTFMQSVVKKIIVSNIEACDEVWAVSRSAGENLISLGYKGGYRVMDNGVDFAKGKADDERIRELNAELDLPGDIPIFLYIGRMMWYKGIKLTLDGLQKAKAAGTRFKMIFVGGGTDFEAIVEHAHSNGLGSDCIFTGPVRDREKLRAFYSRADMFLFPSSFDLAPISMREASACGLASVLVRGSSSAEPVIDGTNAVLIDEDADSLAQTVMDLARNKDYMKALGDRAMNDLYLSWDTAVASAIERYKEILQQRESIE
ncbi:MAG: glycosyltransferase [Oscillospiraceae bacterium]|nr:glycosyltransferase [Oscillospiraceae bacterium]